MGKCYNFCTLFDSGYLDRGIVMYESLRKVVADFKLYIVAFDEKCEEVLKNERYKYVEVISYKEFEDAELFLAKQNRSRKEFIWTCSAYSIKYVLERYGISECTYIDADMYFYNDPTPLIEEIKENEMDVGIIEHGFGQHMEYKYMEKQAGKYCVQFNTFYNNENGLKILNWWTKQCLECCTGIPDGNNFGDQKYLDEFTKLFTGVYEHKNCGAGIAPWNMDRFEIDSEGNVRERKGKKIVPVIFVHYHSMEFIGTNQININVFVRPGKHDKKFIYSLYNPYIRELIRIRKKTSEKYGIKWSVKEGYIEKNSTNNLLRDFLLSEPNLIFLIRKIWRFMLYKRLDFIDYRLI